MNTLPYAHKNQQGFTAVEMLITIVVAGVFITASYVLFIAVNQSFALTRNRAVASDIAYTYLRKYASAGSTSTWFTCSTASGSSNTNDLTVNPNAAGSTVGLPVTLTTADTRLPSPVTVTVTATAVYGCSGANKGKPLRVKSKITYGPNATSIEHATMTGAAE